LQAAPDEVGARRADRAIDGNHDDPARRRGGFDADGEGAGERQHESQRGEAAQEPDRYTARDTPAARAEKRAGLLLTA
jgi:hypothetical protein